ncbi:MAG: MFS transporter [Chloroflexi bacterium]|nr:MFS transporter [Chloroflexota bacterium]
MVETAGAERLTAAHEARLATPLPRHTATFVALEIAPFRWLLLSTITGVLGFQMQAIALGWLVYLLTGSAVSLGLITTVQAVTQTLVSPLAGVIADRVERRSYIMAVRSITVVVAAIVATLVVSGHIRYDELVIAAMMIGIAFGLNGPARQALMAQLVGKDALINAVSLMSGGMNLMRIIGPAIAGFLIGSLGVGGVYILLACLYLAVILAMIPVPRQPAQPGATSRNVLADLRGGLAYSYRQPAVFGLLLFGTIPLFFAMPYASLLPIFAERIWHGGSLGYGVLAAAPGVGGLSGALATATWGHRSRKGLLLIFGAVIYGASLTTFALSPDIPIAALCLGLSGAAGVVYSATVNSLVQSIIPNEMRGRVVSFYQMSFGISGLSALPAGEIATAIGAQATVASCGVLVVLAAIFIYHLRPVLARL